MAEPRVTAGPAIRGCKKLKQKGIGLVHYSRLSHLHTASSTRGPGSLRADVDVKVAKTNRRI